MNKPCIAIAGASGFIGKYAIQKLAKNFKIKALCRNLPIKNNLDPNVEWFACDLFNLKEAEIAFQNCDYILYLIHSMTKGSRLTQSNFVDLDLIIADNVRQSAKSNNIKQIIYVGGIIPEINSGISRHLKSRNEVELVLSYSLIPVTSIRAGIIIGGGGSSFKILYNLVKKLKVMTTPKWTCSMSEPIDVNDIVNFIEQCVANPEVYNTFIDTHGSELISYNDLIIKMSELMNLKRFIITLPFFNLGLSKLWVYLITGVDYFTISPLIDSLKYDLRAVKSSIFNKYIPNPIKLNDSLRNAIEIEKNFEKFPNKSNIEENKVRTVQRLHLPNGWDAIRLGQEYIQWLPKILFTVIKSKINQNEVRFTIFKINLLALEFSEDRSSENRQLFYIRGGLLVIKKNAPQARLEFRKCPHENSAIAAIHDYYPSLPWFIYLIFQANIHRLIMYLFNIHLKKISP